MKFPLLAATLLASTGLAQIPDRFLDQFPDENWAEVPLESPKNWVPADGLAKYRIDGWVAAYDGLDDDVWSDIVKGWCEELPSSKSALIFSDMWSAKESDPVSRHWFGHCFNSTVTTNDLARRDGAKDSSLHVLA